jgi:hypothetical protein
MDEKLMELKESAVGYIDRLEAELPELVLELRAADPSRLAMLADITEGTKWLHDAVVIVSGDPGADRLIDMMDALEGAVKNLDYTLIADILEYEVLELAADWRTVLEK